MKRTAKEVAEEETLSGIVLAQFWWGCSNIHIDMLREADGKPDYDRWAATSWPHAAYHWNSKAAAYKFLRENPRLAEAGYHVVDLADLDWQNMQPRRIRDEVEPAVSNRPPRTGTKPKETPS